MIAKLYLERGMILITDSGTVGRVVFATRYHHDAVGTNNLIRVVVEDEAHRGYLYQFLSSKLGQDQLRANIYGAIVDHIEPDDVKNILVPVPRDRTTIESIGLPVIRSIELQERAQMELDQFEASSRGERRGVRQRQRQRRCGRRARDERGIPTVRGDDEADRLGVEEGTRRQSGAGERERLIHLAEP